MAMASSYNNNKNDTFGVFQIIFLDVKTWNFKISSFQLGFVCVLCCLLSQRDGNISMTSLGSNWTTLKYCLCDDMNSFTLSRRKKLEKRKIYVFDIYQKKNFTQNSAERVILLKFECALNLQKSSQYIFIFLPANKRQKWIFIFLRWNWFCHPQKIDVITNTNESEKIFTHANHVFIYWLCLNRMQISLTLLKNPSQPLNNGRLINFTLLCPRSQK